MEFVVVRLKPKNLWGTWVAILAAYLTAFQLVFAALPPSAHATAPGVDTELFVCAHDGAAETTEGSGRQDAPRHVPECCLFGCAMLGSLLLPSAAAPLPFRAFSALRITVVRRTGALDVRRERSPRVTRGPPSIV